MTETEVAARQQAPDSSSARSSKHRRQHKPSATHASKARAQKTASTKRSPADKKASLMSKSRAKKTLANAGSNNNTAPAKKRHNKRSAHATTVNSSEESSSSTDAGSLVSSSSSYSSGIGSGSGSGSGRSTRNSASHHKAHNRNKKAGKSAPITKKKPAAERSSAGQQKQSSQRSPKSNNDSAQSSNQSPSDSTSNSSDSASTSPTPTPTAYNSLAQQDTSHPMQNSGVPETVNSINPFLNKPSQQTTLQQQQQQHQRPLFTNFVAAQPHSSLQAQRLQQATLFAQQQQLPTTQSQLALQYGAYQRQLLQQQQQQQQQQLQQQQYPQQLQQLQQQPVSYIHPRQHPLQSGYIPPLASPAVPICTQATQYSAQPATGHIWPQQQQPQQQQAPLFNPLAMFSRQPQPQLQLSLANPLSQVPSAQMGTAINRQQQVVQQLQQPAPLQQQLQLIANSGNPQSQFFNIGGAQQGLASNATHPSAQTQPPHSYHSHGSNRGRGQSNNPPVPKPGRPGTWPENMLAQSKKSMTMPTAPTNVASHQRTGPTPGKGITSPATKTGSLPGPDADTGHAHQASSRASSRAESVKKGSSDTDSNNRSLSNAEPSVLVPTPDTDEPTTTNKRRGKRAHRDSTAAPGINSSSKSSRSPQDSSTSLSSSTSSSPSCEHSPANEENGTGEDAPPPTKTAKMSTLTVPRSSPLVPQPRDGTSTGSGYFDIDNAVSLHPHHRFGPLPATPQQGQFATPLAYPQYQHQSLPYMTTAAPSFAQHAQFHPSNQGAFGLGLASTGTLFNETRMCPICTTRSARRSHHGVCSVCYGGLYKHIRKWVKTKPGIDLHSKSLVEDFLVGFKKLPRGCRNSFKCYSLMDAAKASECTKCRSIKLCDAFPNLARHMIFSALKGK